MLAAAVDSDSNTQIALNMRQHESVQERTCLVNRLKLLQIVELYLSSYSTQHILQLFNAPWFGESRDKWWSLLWHELHEGRLLNWLLFYIHNFLPTYSHPQHDLKDRCGPPSKDAKTYITQTHKGKVHRRLDPFPSQNSFFKKGKVWLICLATFWPHALFLSCIEEERHVIYIVHGGVHISWTFALTIHYWGQMIRVFSPWRVNNTN